MVKRISYNWSTIVENVGFVTEDREHFQTKSFSWKSLHLYPTCQIIDFYDYFNMTTFSPPYVYFHPHMVEGLSLTIYVFERNKKTQRPLKSSFLSYSGPKISIPNLNEPRLMKIHNKISQSIHIDSYQKCQDYPNSQYDSFDACDREFVKKKCNEYNIVPLWVTQSFEDVSETK